jgi:hypothetical protein
MGAERLALEFRRLYTGERTPIDQQTYHLSASDDLMLRSAVRHAMSMSSAKWYLYMHHALHGHFVKSVNEGLVLDCSTSHHITPPNISSWMPSWVPGRS